VEVSVPGRLGRWSGVVGLRDVRTALISALVTATVGALTNVFEANEVPPSADPGGSKQHQPSHALWWLFAAAIAIALVGLALLSSRRRNAGTATILHSVLAVGVGCAAALFALYLFR
jgi:hypothetical protein